MKRDDLEASVRLKYKDSLAAMRGWFSEGDQSGESSVGLLEDDEVNSLPGLPCVEEEKPPTRARNRCFAGWNVKAALRVFWFLMPSFFARLFGQAGDDAKIPAANTTSYLNGLRGIACVIVAVQHNCEYFDHILYHAWGDAPQDRHIIQLLFLRDLTSGVFMVAIFFVLSGFVLSYGPLKKSHNDRAADAVSSLPSSVFRRPFRLFLPVIPVLAATLVLIRFHAFYVPQRKDPMPPVANGILQEAAYLWHTLVVIITQGSNSTIMPQGWTLTAEYQGSLLVFLCCLAFARASPWLRISSVLLLITYLFNLGQWQQCLFLAGMILADLRHAREKLPALEGTAARWAAAVASWLLFATALMLGGWPYAGNPYAAPGFSWFRWVPTGPVTPFYFFTSVSAVMLVSALENLPVLQRGLNARWILYLGEISYGLYLVHWIVAQCPLTKGVAIRLSGAGHSLVASWSVGILISIPLAICVGDVHWRLVDQKSVRFSHWLSKKCGI